MSEKVARRAGIRARALASLTLFCAGVWLVPSGIALCQSDGKVGHSASAKVELPGELIENLTRA